MLAVLLIHTTANARTLVPWGSLSAPVYIAANQLSMFAVPVFLMMNGLVLFYRYHDDWSLKQAAAFYKKRIQFILVPYLLWSVLYYAGNQLIATHQVHVDAGKFWEMLVWGKSGYHLYFMVIVIQFYVVFPILMTLVRLLKLNGLAVLALGLIVQGVFYFIHHWVKPIDHFSALMPNYSLVFCTGAAIGMHYEWFAACWRQVWWTMGLGAAIGFMYILMLLSAEEGAHYWPPAYVILYNVYAVVMGVSLIWSGKIVCERLSGAVRAVLEFGAISFGVYLIHPMLLTIWRQLADPSPQNMYYHPYNLITYILLVAASWLIVRYTKRIKWSWMVWGR
ncbi:acyltransferase [Paenibacillus protaetiae]|nr:acyltransferase [Paenibacillus protaetiae]